MNSKIESPKKVVAQEPRKYTLRELTELIYKTIGFCIMWDANPYSAWEHLTGEELPPEMFGCLECAWRRKRK